MGDMLCQHLFSIHLKHTNNAPPSTHNIPHTYHWPHKHTPYTDTQTPTPTTQYITPHTNTHTYHTRQEKTPHTLYTLTAHTTQNTHTHTTHKYPSPPHIHNTRSTNISYHTTHSHTHSHSQTDTLTHSQGTKEKTLGKQANPVWAAYQEWAETEGFSTDGYWSSPSHLPGKPFWGVGPSEHKS